MRLKRLACFYQCLQPGEDARPAVDAGVVAGIVSGPLVMSYGDPGGLTLRHQFYRDARDLAGSAEGECILQQLWRLRLEHLTANVGNWLPVGPFADPVHATAGLQIGFEFGPSKDDAVRFGGDEALPDFIRGCGEVENEVQWSLLGHGDLLRYYLH